MKRLAALLTALVMMLVSLPALAEDEAARAATGTVLTLSPDATVVSGMLNNAVDPSLVSAVCRVIGGLGLGVTVQDTGAKLWLEAEGEELLNVLLTPTADGDVLISGSLLRGCGILMPVSGVAALPDTDLSGVTGKLAEALLTWLSALPYEAETGTCAGSLFDDGVDSVTVTVDDAALAALLDACCDIVAADTDTCAWLNAALASEGATAQTLLERLRAIDAEVAANNRYTLRVIGATLADGGTAWTCSLLDSGVCMASASLRGDETEGEALLQLSLTASEAFIHANYQITDSMVSLAADVHQGKKYATWAVMKAGEPASRYSLSLALDGDSLLATGGAELYGETTSFESVWNADGLTADFTLNGTEPWLTVSVKDRAVAPLTAETDGLLVIAADELETKGDTLISAAQMSATIALLRLVTLLPEEVSTTLAPYIGQ